MIIITEIVFWLSAVYDFFQLCQHQAAFGSTFVVALGALGPRSRLGSVLLGLFDLVFVLCFHCKKPGPVWAEVTVAGKFPESTWSNPLVEPYLPIVAPFQENRVCCVDLWTWRPRRQTKVFICHMHPLLSFSRLIGLFGECVSADWLAHGTASMSSICADFPTDFLQLCSSSKRMRAASLIWSRLLFCTRTWILASMLIRRVPARTG